MFTYLKEITALNLSRILDVGSYDQVLWFADVPRSEACYSVPFSVRLEADTDLWLEIKKLAEPQPPPPPPACDRWYIPAKLRNSVAEPVLLDRIQIAPADPATGDPAQYFELGLSPNVTAGWNLYLEKHWRPWAELHKVWKAYHLFYSSLFTLEQQVKRLGEAYELIVGFGLLSWIGPNGERVRRHLVATRGSLRFDPPSGTISLRAAAEGAAAALEYDMLDPEQRPIPAIIKNCEIQVASVSEDPWSQAAMAPLLKSWVNAMSDRGSYDPGVVPPQTLSQHPTITFAPAIILRRRNRRSVIGLLQGIADRLRAMAIADIPFGVQRLCEVVPEIGADQATEAGEPAKPGEIYFPLPANEEQRLIVQRLRRSRGILVQGPPGTGKSQTIANLLCHLLAEGKRILVTSQTERALKVLQNKLPREMWPLCVTVLGQDESAMRNLEASVLGINEQNTSWEPEKNRRTIDDLEREVEGLRAQKAKVEARMLQLREVEYREFTLADGRVQGTAAAISRCLDQQKECHGWISDPVPEQMPLPVTPEELGLVHMALIRLTPERRREAMQHVCLPSAINTGPKFVEFARAESEARATWDSFAAMRESQNTRIFLTWSPAERQSLRAEIDALRSAIAVAQQDAADWAAKALREVLIGRVKPWADFCALNESRLAQIGANPSAVFSRELSIPVGRDRSIVHADATSLLAHLRAGGKMGLGPFRPKPVRQALYVIREIRVDGRLCDGVNVIGELVEYLTVERAVDQLWDQWSVHVGRVNGPLGHRHAELDQNVGFLRRLNKVGVLLIQLKDRISGIPGISPPAWQDDASVVRLLKEIEAAEAHRLFTYAQEAFGAAKRQLEDLAASPSAHPIVTRTLEALDSRDPKKYAQSLDLASTLLADREEWLRAEQIAARLRKVAPRTIAELEADPKAAHWPIRIQELREAWDWSRSHTWLMEFHAKNDQTMEDEFRRLEKKIATALAEIAAAKAWRCCLERLTEEERQHMIAWYQAIKRIGKGTGIRADLHRANARLHMDKCRGAIPAWIMPFYRVAETVGNKPEPYDVVIVDEASQSGPEACALFYMAKSVIVVGDDKQISPSAVGIERAQVDQLTEQYLFDIEHRDGFGVESSLFSQAQLRFGARIRLKEHFRCMPEIIRFSNELCYTDEPLLPLRQYPPKRLEPIIVRHVANGLREGKENAAEAEAIANTIIDCCANPAYLKKTIGVISLLGDEQTNLIRRIVVARLEPREIEEREITFGDAYAFQGDERDIIFLSMVVAPNMRTGTLSGKGDEQRFNVACSRARDQIWLFHSLGLDGLSTGDIRHRLLSYYLSPDSPPPLEPEWDKCESHFEVFVGRIIHGRGYRLIAQYEPFGRGGKRLDFVVEGSSGRMAVECDGDAFHSTPDQIHDDLVRERVLERCGWAFWRVRESVFHADREKAMAPLWQRLADLGIAPRAPEPPASIVPAEKKTVPNPIPSSAAPPQIPVPTGENSEAPMVRAAVNVPRYSAPRGEQQDLFLPPSKPAKEAPDLSGVERMVLERLAVLKRVETNPLILEVSRRMGFRREDRRKIEAAIESLERKGLVTVGVNYVGKRDVSD